MFHIFPLHIKLFKKLYCPIQNQTLGNPAAWRAWNQNLANLIPQGTGLGMRPALQVSADQLLQMVACECHPCLPDRLALKLSMMISQLSLHQKFSKVHVPELVQNNWPVTIPTQAEGQWAIEPAPVVHSEAWPARVAFEKPWCHSPQRHCHSTGKVLPTAGKQRYIK